MTTNNILENKDCAGLFKALSDPIRLNIIHELLKSPLCVSDLMETLSLSQSHVSHHLKTLKVSGLIESKRDGHKIYYNLPNNVRTHLSQTKQESIDLGCCEVHFKKSS